MASLGIFPGATPLPASGLPTTLVLARAAVDYLRVLRSVLNGVSHTAQNAELHGQFDVPLEDGGGLATITVDATYLPNRTVACGVGFSRGGVSLLDGHSQLQFVLAFVKVLSNWRVEAISYVAEAEHILFTFPAFL